jgi:integrase
MTELMQNLYRLYRRDKGAFYAQNRQNGKQLSLKTKDRAQAGLQLNALNESARDAVISRDVGMTYLFHADPLAKTRTWGTVCDQMLLTKTGNPENHRRWSVAFRDQAIVPLRPLKVVDTRAEDFLRTLNSGCVSTNTFLRRLHNFALDMGWLARPIIPRRQWPRIKPKKKRAITQLEHERIIEREGNPERRDYYMLLWYTGASQGDMAKLRSDDVDWNTSALRFFRRKNGAAVWQRLGPSAMVVLRRRPQGEFLFPYLATVRPGDRSTEFKQRCKGLGIKGVSLHSYRYAWASRGKKVAYPARYAQAALGHSSRAVHERYAGTEEVWVPSLEEYESKMADAAKTAQAVGAPPLSVVAPPCAA